MRKPYNIGICGAGQIAQGFDSPGDPVVLTMAHAIQKTPSFNLGGFFDLDISRALAAEKRWNIPATSRDRKSWFAQGWDVIYIATPDSEHARDLAQAIQARPRAIIVEKPLAVDGPSAEALLDQAHACQVPVIVNFPRRYHSAMNDFRKRLRDLTFTSPTSVFCAYSGGFAHNAVHLVDLFAELWGDDWDIESVEGMSDRRTFLMKRDKERFSWIFSEPSIANHYLLEMHVYGKEGIVRVAESPEFLTLSVPNSHPQYKRFSVFQQTAHAPMEMEPLLCQELSYLAVLLQDPKSVSTHQRREHQRQRFIGHFLKAIHAQEKETAACNR